MRKVHGNFEKKGNFFFEEGNFDQQNTVSQTGL